MRLWVVVPTAVAALALTASAPAQTVGFNADVQASFGIRNSIECPPDLDCGRARIVGFGKATRTLAITGFTPGVPIGCNSVTAVEHMVLESDGSSLDLQLDAALCAPGGSANSNDSPRGLITSLACRLRGESRRSAFQGARRTARRNHARSWVYAFAPGSLPNGGWRQRSERLP